jgi:protocatechuate 3,4-dioxygenase alpha subunit
MADDLLKESASQTAGPYVHIGCVPSFAGIDGVYPHDLGSQMVGARATGTRITLEGRVIDGDGVPLTDAMIELWHANPDGQFPTVPFEQDHFDQTGFFGWGRQATDADTGLFRFETLKPGRVAWPDGRLQAPFLALWITARGINLGLHTRIYFPDEAAANTEDPLLSQIDPARAATLVAQGTDTHYTFDIHLQGDNETVFFDI